MELDEKKIWAAKNGSEEAFVEIYSVLYKDMYKFACFVMGSTIEAEDIVAEAVLDIWQQLHKLKDVSAFKNWAFTIISNKCKRQMRKKKEIPMDFFNECDGMFYGKEWMDEEDIINLEMMDVEQVFRRLNQDEKLIVAYTIFAGYDSNEIGKIMRINPNTVRSKLKRALEKMKKMLEPSVQE